MKLRIVKGFRNGTSSEAFRVELFVNGAWEQTPFVWSSMEQAMYELVQRAAEDRGRRRWTVVQEFDSETWKDGLPWEAKT